MTYEELENEIERLHAQLATKDAEIKENFEGMVAAERRIIDALEDVCAAIPGTSFEDVGDLAKAFIAKDAEIEMLRIELIEARHPHLPRDVVVAELNRHTAFNREISKMTEEEVRQRVSSIELLDPETAHSEEDGIHQDVLKAIAEGAKNPERLAAAALDTLKFDFSRWYA